MHRPPDSPPRSGLPRLVGLALLGLASLALYGHLFSLVGGLDSGTDSGLADHLPLSRDLIERPFANRQIDSDLAKATRHAEATPPYLIAVSALFVLYVAAIRLAGRTWSGTAAAMVAVFATLFQSLAVLAPDMLSTDLFAYLLYGRIYGVYGASPYHEVPAQYPGDPFFHLVYWKYVPSFYGPLWTLISGAVVRAAGHDQVAAVLLFKGVQAVAAAGATLIVTATLRRFSPSLALGGTILMGWNPLVVVESGLSGHNDMLVGFLIVVAVASAAWRWPGLAAGALALAGMVKLVALALIPSLVLFLLRRESSWRGRALAAIQTSLGVALAVALSLWPIWSGPETFAVLTLGSSGDRYTNGLGELALGELRVWLGESREDMEVPLQFKGWWVATHTDSSLRAERRDNAALLLSLEPWTELLVVGPEKDGWLRAYEPTAGTVGFVRSSTLGPIERPPAYQIDQAVLAREEGPTGSPVLQEANRIIRLAGWSGFGVVWLGTLLLGSGSLGGVLVGWLAVLLALYYLASAWFWPWYLLWAIPIAALAPPSIWSRWLIFLSWGVLLLYGALGFGGTDLWFLQTYRSLAVFGLPLLILLVDTVPRLLLALGRWLRSIRLRGRRGSPSLQASVAR